MVEARPRPNRGALDGRCPRCRGLYYTEDYDGVVFIGCRTCGYRKVAGFKYFPENMHMLIAAIYSPRRDRAVKQGRPVSDPPVSLDVVKANIARARERARQQLT